MHAQNLAQTLAHVLHAPPWPALQKEPGLGEILAGLTARRKELPTRLLYDQAGSRLFEMICLLPEYYLARAESEILTAQAAEIARRIGAGALLAELGSGSSIKTRSLLDALPTLAAYVPIDISRQHLADSARAIAAAYPTIDVIPLYADFTQVIELPRLVLPPHRVVFFFPGSTIGNLDNGAACRLLARLRRAAGPNGGLVIGLDLVKPAAVLEAAYNDSAGITASFNCNLLTRLNREYGANFCVGAFRHSAIWHEDQQRIEMRLVSTRAQRVEIGGTVIEFDAGEAIHTEFCHKYTVGGFATLARGCGWALQDAWTDRQQRFSVQYLSAA